jgi:hypothetical protein
MELTVDFLRYLPLTYHRRGAMMRQHIKRLKIRRKTSAKLMMQPV